MSTAMLIAHNWHSQSDTPWSVVIAASFPSAAAIIAAMIAAKNGRKLTKGQTGINEIMVKVDGRLDAALAKIDVLEGLLTAEKAK